VFYAMNDARTPTIINAVTVVLKVILFYAAGHVLDPHRLVYGLTFVNGLGFLTSTLVGQYWLRRKVGMLDTPRIVRTLLKVGVAAAWGAGAALLVAKGIDAVVPASAALLRAWLVMVIGGLVGLAITFGLMSLLRVSEINPLTRRLSGLVKRGRPA
jgi:putative peptidoglycan lipid II flippase